MAGLTRWDHGRLAADNPTAGYTRRMSAPAGPHTARDRPARPADPRAARGADVRPTDGLLGRGVLAALVGTATAIPAGLLLLAVRSPWPPVQRLDQRMLEVLHEPVLQSPALPGALRAVALITHPWLLRVVALAIAVVLWRRGRRRLAGWLLTTMAVGGSLAGVLKVVVQRARPVLPEPVATAHGYSFPSGHALTSVLLVVTLLVLLPPGVRGVRRVAARLAAIGFVLLVGWDRVALGVHYASDVLAGWVVAFAVLACTSNVFFGWRWFSRWCPAEPRASGGLSPRPSRRRP